jgi:thiopurine S-methyltransferase
VDHGYWRARWQEGRIGFHEGRPNDLLVAHARELGEGTRVFVPLCGKTEDMAWLAERGHRIVGVELEANAVQAFYAARGLTPEIARRGRLDAYSAGPYVLLAGDFFDVGAEHLDGASAVYDRAAIVALPREMRAQYGARLHELFAPGTRALTITLSYAGGAAAGPPFSVDGEELRRVYPGAAIDLLEERPVTSGRLHDEGIAAVEQAWRVVF